MTLKYMRSNSVIDSPIKVVSLFSGAGGLDIGFENTGYFNTVMCAELDEDCVNTLILNKEMGIRSGTHSYLSNSDIQHIDLSTPEEAFSNHADSLKCDVLIGGPPCQSFSVAGKRGGTSDVRGGLIKSFIDCVTLLNPRAFVLENVPGIATIENGNVLSFITDSASRLGYSIWSGKLCAADYGDPTIRVRYFIIAVKNPINPILAPRKTHFSTHDIGKLSTYDSTQMLPHQTVKEALGMLPDASGEPGELNGHVAVNHKPEVIQRFLKLKPGERDNARRRNRLNPDLPSLTLFSGGNKGKRQARSHIHPYYPRELTPRECARLHSFPDYWLFCGGHDSMLTQISNSVPINLAEAVARSILLSLGSINYG